jgi:predicted metal-dependent enzyme (double-stranded beta helix superfamily)
MAISQFFREFITEFEAMLENSGGDEDGIFSKGEPLLRELIATDLWLPEAYSRPAADAYRQNLLYCDAQERFSVVCFVWGPGQSTPIHDHTVWGLIGMLRGSERCEEFSLEPETRALRAGNNHVLLPGDIDRVSPRVGDIHRVSNALSDKPSMSIHVYGGNIGALRRHTYAYPGPGKNDFVSGYSNAGFPGLLESGEDG